MHTLNLLFLLATAAVAAGPDPKAALAVLNSEAEVHAKAVACQQLAVSGGPEAVPALAGLLGHEQLSDYARCALEAIPDPAAGEALLKATATLKGRLLAGVIDSLGARRQAESTQTLLRLLISGAAHGPREVAEAALSALGRIADKDAVNALRNIVSDDPLPLAPEWVLTAAGHAALVAAERSAREGRREEALGLLDKVAAATLPAQVQAAAASLAADLRGGKRPAAGAAARALFDGKGFDGWEGDPAWFRVEEGAIIAGRLDRPIPRNEFLCTVREFGDFELWLKVRLAGNQGNGGIQFRSQRVPGSSEMAGYQADVGDGYWGGLYDESRRNRFMVPAPDQAAAAQFVKPDDWNEYVIRCEGARVRLWLNGRLTADFTEPDPAMPRRGRIGVQIHAGPPCEVRYKDLAIRELGAAGKTE